MNHIKESGVKRKVQANAVLAQEVLLSASPEHFRPDDPAQAGTWDQERMEEWRDASLKFLQDKYGDHLVDCRLHLDESTPHMHGIVVPITQGPKGPKLSAKECFGKIDLRKLQDEYPKALQAHGLSLDRGIKGSKAKHTKIKQYYEIANRDECRDVPRLKIPERMFLKKDREAYRDQKNASLKKRLGPTFQKAEGADLERKKRKEYQHTAQALSEKVKELKANLKTANDRVRETPLALVLEKAGLDPELKDKKQWIGSGHRITVEGQKWYDHGQGKGAGGAIDLTMHLRQCNFKKAVAWLAQNISIDEAARAIRDQARATAQALKDLDVSFQLPLLALDQIPALKKYLAEDRGLDPAITDPLIEKGVIYPTKHYQYTNAVFLCYDSEGLTGAEIKGLRPNPKTGKSHKGSAPGTSRKDGAFFIGETDNKHAVFVESAIDAIAYKQLHPEPCLVISTAGATTAPQFVKILQRDGWDLTVAYDNDGESQRYAQAFIDQYPEAGIETPEEKDWNKVLETQKTLPDLDLIETISPSM